MIRKNIRLAVRLIFKHKNISIINIIGLSFSLACALFILLWVQHELSYDRFHPDYKHIYRVEEDQYYSNPEAYHVNVTPRPSGPVWKEEIPEIIEQCRIAFTGGALFNYEDQKYFEGNTVCTDSSFFKMFGFELIQGNPDNILTEPNTMVISDEIAHKYFGDENAIGKSIKVNNDQYLTVAGIMKKAPRNTVIPVEILFPWEFNTRSPYYNATWDNNSIFTFIKTNDLAEDSIVNRKITEVTDKYKAENTIDFVINPIHRVHLHSYFGFGHSPGAILYVYIFSGIAILVIIIACINFMNMSTARSSVRAKEIGLRKVSGASKNQLSRQYLMESFVQTFVSTLFAFFLVLLLLNKFNDISGKDIAFGQLFNTVYLLGILAILVITGLIAGMYPAFYLASIQPIRAIKENNDARKGSGLLRKILVVFQFSLAILLISGALIVNRQLNYMRNADLGFNKEHLINVPLRGGLNEHYYTLKEEFMSDPNIEYISASMQEAYNIGSNSSGIDWPGKDPEQQILVSFSAVDVDFTETMGIKMEQGRGFSEDFPGDKFKDTTANFLINQTLASFIEEEEMIGMSMSFMGIHGQVVGIMEDFHFSPLRDEMEPLAVIVTEPELLNNMMIRLKTENIDEALKVMEESWNTIVPQYPFEYSFVDEEIDNMYRAEERMTRLMSIFTIIAILISCMGLFALASFTAEKRTREIGIRKTFGANGIRITRMLILDFTKLTFISLIIGLPLVWYLANRWLKDFSFRIDLKSDIFLYSALVVISVTIITILYHSVKSARMNVVRALRYE